MLQIWQRLQQWPPHTAACSGPRKRCRTRPRRVEPGRWRHKLRRIGGSGRGAVSSHYCQLSRHNTTSRSSLVVAWPRDEGLCRSIFDTQSASSLITQQIWASSLSLLLLLVTLAQSSSDSVQHSVSARWWCRVGRVRCSVYRLSRPARHTAQRQLHTFCNYITLYEVPDTTFGQRGNCV